MSRKEKAKQRPLALNTVEMLRVASSALGTKEEFYSDAPVTLTP